MTVLLHLDLPHFTNAGGVIVLPLIILAVTVTALINRQGGTHG